jgi:nucleotide-binding universal stress UspA family protein
MLKTFALAVDGSVHANRAIPLAIELAKLAGGKVIVFHVREHDLQRGQIWELETEKEANAVVKKAMDKLKKAGIKVQGDVIRTAHGKVAQALVDSAKDRKVDAIVLGSRGLSDLEGLVLGSVAHKVIHLSTKPVIVAR